MSDNLRRYIIWTIMINIIIYLIIYFFYNSGNKEKPTTATYTSGIDIQQIDGDLNSQLDKLLSE